MNLLKVEKKGQSAVEYLLMFAAVTIVVFTALAPNGFFTRAVNESLNTSILDGTEIMARCVCYDPATGDPCTPVCGNGCCEEGESGSCAADCEGDTYSWSTLGWGPCVPVCGAGTRSRVVHCTRDSDGTIVSDGHCSGVKPVSSEACAGEDCNYYWRESGYGQCSALCGPGTQSMTYECVRGYDGTVTFSSYCASLPAPPDLSQACDLGQCCTCAFESACTDGSVPCCGLAGCGVLEHSEIQLCTPTGCVNPMTLQTQCTPHAECCSEEPQGCRQSPCGWNERRYQRTCGDGTVTTVCHEDGACVLVCGGSSPIDRATLCPGDDTGLMTTASHHAVSACSDVKCEWECNPPFSPDPGGGACVCPSNQMWDGSACVCPPQIPFWDGTLCVCQPDCTGKNCGPDGCGGSCGPCIGSQRSCVNGICICTPSCPMICGRDGCQPRQCGSDGCGGDCGTCPPQHSCSGGICYYSGS